MIIEVRIPSPGESITEAEISSWLVNNGDFVDKDQEIAEIESDKATLPLIAEESGIINIVAEEGKTIKVGSVACTIDSQGKNEKNEKGVKEQKQDTTKQDSVKNKDEEIKSQKPKESVSDPDKTQNTGNNETAEDEADPDGKIKISPLAKKHMEDKGLSLKDILTGLKRLTKEDVEVLADIKGDKNIITAGGEEKKSRDAGRKKMSMLRRRLSQRLIAVKNETAMLTTFNEVDMSRIIEMRKKYQSVFVEKHGVKLGFMSFFTKAATEALKAYPNVNSYIEQEDIITPEYCDIGIAMQTDKGLMVPVIRNTESLSLAGIEKSILNLAEKAKKNRISIEDLSGGTFTITNGGVFGSLFSTPILNPPQSGILGMHNIVERPVAVKGRVKIRPMMYIALSYDHRIIDGRDSVSFLVKVKEMIEDPLKMIFNGNDPLNVLLNL